jgi:hypothetical protein
MIIYLLNHIVLNANIDMILTYHIIINIPLE